MPAQGCILFLLDCSASMAAPWADGEPPVCDSLAAELNGCLGYIQDESHLHAAVVSYNTDRVGKAQLTPQPAGSQSLATDGFFQGPQLAQLSHAANAAWLTPTAHGGTPTCTALEDCRRRVATWIDRNPAGFPPVMVHLTDGRLRDGPPRQPLAKLHQLSTERGSLLLINCIIDLDAKAIVFPHAEQQSEADPNSLYALWLRNSSAFDERQWRYLAGRLERESHPLPHALLYGSIRFELLDVLEMAVDLALGRHLQDES